MHRLWIGFRDSNQFRTVILHLCLPANVNLRNKQTIINYLHRLALVTLGLISQAGRLRIFK
jgi:hypothetical protein